MEGGRSRGVDLVRVEYIPDDAREISESVLRLKQRVGSDGFVFTSGGIGPTRAFPRETLSVAGTGKFFQNKENFQKNKKELKENKNSMM